MLSPSAYIAIGVLFALFVLARLKKRKPAQRKPAQREPSPFAHRFDADELARRLEMSLEDLQKASPEYRTAVIPKSSGGERGLEIPDETTRDLQRKILRRVLSALECHPFACGFERHTSIVDAALPHVGKDVIIKLDVRRFFESTTENRIRAYFEDIGWASDAADLLVRLTCHNGHLPQGAPTSPRLSNLVNSPMDAGLLHLAKLHDGSYSRYADDITLSFDLRSGRRIRGIIQAARRIARSYGYALHGGRKQQVLRQHQQQRVLGLVVNSQVALPRKTRRLLRSVEHRLASGREATLTPEQLAGWKAFAVMVERQRAE